MAINLGAMIQAARSQRNPAGEAITNFQRQGLMSQLLSGQGNTQNSQSSGSQPAQSMGLWEIVSKYLPFIGG